MKRIATVLLAALPLAVAAQTELKVKLFPGFQALTVMAATSQGFFERQGLWCLLGLGLLWVAARFDYHRLRRIAAPIALVTVLLLVAVLLPHVGLELNGARRWLRLGPMSRMPTSSWGRPPDRSSGRSSRWGARRAKSTSGSSPPRNRAGGSRETSTYPA